MADSDIKKLLARIKGGDRLARKELLELLADEKHFQLLILNMARKMMPRNHPARRLIDSHDLIQSALGAAFRGLPGFRGGTERSFFGWLKTIIHHKIERARRTVEKEKQREKEPPERRDFIEEILDEETLQTLWKAIGKLPLDQLLVINLRIRGLKSIEIADILSLTPAAVRKREERAVENLRGLLKA